MNEQTDQQKHYFGYNHFQTENLQQLGVKKAAESQCDPTVLVSWLKTLWKGAYLDEGQVRRKTETEIDQLENEIQTFKAKNIELDGNLKNNERNITKRKEEIEDLVDEKKDFIKNPKIEKFNPGKFVFLLLFILALSTYLIYFYISVGYKGLVLSTDEIARRLGQGFLSNSILPSTNELITAITSAWGLILVPLVIFAFGIGLHIFLEKKGKIKIIGTAGVVFFTLVLDILLAILVHSKLNEARELMGQETIEWFKSVEFFVIIVLGFVTYLFWSLFYDTISRELQKKDPFKQRDKIINMNNKEIEELSKQNQEFTSLKEKNDLEIKLKERLKGGVQIFTSDLINNLSRFYTGWINHLKASGAEDKFDASKSLYEAFIKNK